MAKLELDICSDSCPVTSLDLDGVDNRPANEVLLHLQWDGSISRLSDEELEQYRLTEIDAWRAEPSRIGIQAVEVLQNHPEVMKAARICAELQELGECVYLDKYHEGENNG